MSGHVKTKKRETKLEGRTCKGIRYCKYERIASGGSSGRFPSAGPVAAEACEAIATNGVNAAVCIHARRELCNGAL